VMDSDHLLSSLLAPREVGTGARFERTFHNEDPGGVGAAGWFMNNIWIVSGYLLVTPPLICIIYLIWTVYILRRDIKRGKWTNTTATLITRLVQKCGRQYNEGFRRDFQSRFVVEKNKPPSGHSHGRDACERTGVNYSIDHFIESSGYSVYSVSFSSRDNNQEGYHQGYMSRDLIIDGTSDKVTKQHIIKMVDVDYHLDIGHWVKKKRPIVMYTMVPMSLSGESFEGHYTVNDGCVELTENGGASYQHPLWDYSSDWITFEYWWGSIVCSVDSKHVSEHRRVILLTPEFETYGPFGWLVPGRRIRRQSFRVGPGVQRLDTTDEDGKRWASLKLDGRHTAVTVPVTLLEAAIIRLNNTKHPEICTVERFMNIEKDLTRELPTPFAASILYECITKTDRGLEINVQPRGGKVRWCEPVAFQAIGSIENGYLATEDGKRIGRTVGVCIVDQPAVVPNESWNNDMASVTGRVTRLYNDTVPPQRLNALACEFIRKLIPIPGIGALWSLDQVLEQRQKPAQRAKDEKEIPWITTQGNCHIQAFMKHEAMAKTNDPRNISSMPAQHNLRLAQMTYPFKEIFKNFHWYMPGLKPREIAGRVVSFVSGFAKVVETDYSRWDGHLSVWMRVYLERAAVMRWLPDMFRAEFGRLIDQEVVTKGRTRHGVVYMNDGGRGSGSYLTEMNTLENAFISYAASRLDGHNIDEAWCRIGCVGGDDGVSGALRVSIERAAAALGLKLKAKERTTGDSVSFLGRVYIDPWTTDSSIQDPVRTLAKLHISFAAPEVPDDVALANRAIGYHTLDPTTPILSAWCERFLDRTSGTSGHLVDELTKYGARVSCDTPYYIRGDVNPEGETWPQPPMGSQLVVQRMAELLECSGNDILAWDHAIRNAETDAEIEGIVKLPRVFGELPCVLDDGSGAFITPGAGAELSSPTRGMVQTRLESTIETFNQEAANANRDDLTLVVVQPRVFGRGEQPGNRAVQPRGTYEVRRGGNRRKFRRQP